MHPLRKRRLLTVLGMTFGISVGVALLMYALKSNINLYLTPSEVTPQHRALTHLRMGGMVQRNSVQRGKDSLKVDFAITDYKRSLTVHYEGVLPALFREGQGVVIEGRLTAKGELVATRVLAKHDEKYRPPSIPNHPESTV